MNRLSKRMAFIWLDFQVSPVLESPELFLYYTAV